MGARTGDPACAARSAQMQVVFGSAVPPIEVHVIGHQPLITRVFKEGQAQPGDVILKIDGKPVQSRIDELSHYLAGAGAARDREPNRPLPADFQIHQ